MSSYFEESHIRQILQAVDIVDVVANYVALKPRGKEMLGLCPFHSDTRPSLNVSPSKQIFKCFSCGAGGDVIKFIMLREQMTFPESVRFLADRAGITLPEKKYSATQAAGVDRNALEKVNRWAARFYRDQYEHPETGRVAREYIEERKINEDTARRFGLGWAPDSWDNLANAAQKQGISFNQLSLLGLVFERETGGFYDRFRGRLMFPVLDALGRVIAFGGRTLIDDPAKYMNSPESPLFNKSRTHYGLHAAKDSIVKERTAIIVEGYTDCLMAHQAGITNVVAALGTALTTQHAQTLSRYADKIVLVFDSDAAGQKAADRAIEIFLHQQIEVSIVTLPTGQDPCDFLIDNGKEAFEQLARQGEHALEYKWRSLKESLEKTDTVRGRKRAVDEYLALIGDLASKEKIDQLSQGYLLNHVAKLIRVSQDDVYQQIRKRQPRFSRDGQSAARTEALITDGLVRSQQEVLEVLLNRPDLFPTTRDVIPQPDSFQDTVHGQIAERIWSCLEENERATLAEIMAGCESTELCKKILDLADRGEKRGNYEETLQGALNNIVRINQQQDQQALSGIVSQTRKDFGKDALNALLQEIHLKANTPDPKRFVRIRR